MLHLLLLQRALHGYGGCRNSSNTMHARTPPMPVPKQSLATIYEYIPYGTPVWRLSCTSTSGVDSRDVIVCQPSLTADDRTALCAKVLQRLFDVVTLRKITSAMMSATERALRVRTIVDNMPPGSSYVLADGFFVCAIL